MHESSRQPARIKPRRAVTAHAPRASPPLRPLPRREPTIRRPSIRARLPLLPASRQPLDCAAPTKPADFCCSPPAGGVDPLPLSLVALTLPWQEVLTTTPPPPPPPNHHICLASPPPALHLLTRTALLRSQAGRRPGDKFLVFEGSPRKIRFSRAAAPQVSHNGESTSRAFRDC